MQEEFITVEPKNNQLKKYISCYYFHRSFSDDFRKQFIFYPNYNHALTVYKNSRVEIRDNSSTVYPEPGKKLSQFYSNNVDRAILVTLNGHINKIGIVFKPLGINHFMTNPLKGEMISKTMNAWEFSHLGADFEAVLLQVYETLDVDKKTALLDDFFTWQQQKSTFCEPLLDKAVEEIIRSGGTIPVTTVTKMLNISDKTLLRLFQKQLFCTISDFKKLVRFRNTLNNALDTPQFKTLTELALSNQYYDQADFINQFKKITGLTPKLLFSQITELGNHGIYWSVKDN